MSGTYFSAARRSRQRHGHLWLNVGGLLWQNNSVITAVPWWTALAMLTWHRAVASSGMDWHRRNVRWRGDGQPKCSLKTAAGGQWRTSLNGGYFLRRCYLLLRISFAGRKRRHLTWWLSRVGCHLLRRAGGRQRERALFITSAASGKRHCGTSSLLFRANRIWRAGRRKTAMTLAQTS